MAARPTAPRPAARAADTKRPCGPGSSRLLSTLGVLSSRRREALVTIALLTATLQLGLPAVSALAQAHPPAPAGPPAARQPPGAAPTARDSPDRRRENKALIRRYLQAVMSEGKLDEVDQLVAATYADRTPGASRLKGPEAVRRARRDLGRRFAKIEYSPQELIAEGDRVVARYLVLATPRDSESARPLVVNGIAIFKILDGKIAETYIMNDDLNLMRQLGYSLQPPPPPGSQPSPQPAAPTAPAEPPPSRSGSGGD